MQRNFLRALALVLMVLVSTLSFGRIREVSLEQRVDSATLIVEGRVLHSTPFYNPEGTRIHTLHEIEVSRIFKAGDGDVQELTTMEVVTPGGRIGDKWHVVQPSLQLAAGDAGIFFVEQREEHAGLAVAHLPYAGSQGFVRYAPDSRTASDPFRDYADVVLDLHQRIQQQLGIDAYTVLPDAPWRGRNAAASAEAAAGALTISNLSPPSIAAGVQSTLTITGSAFGTHTGLAAVLFDNSDDGSGGPAGAADPQHILSWSDTTIEVLVPSRIGSGLTAGTGTVHVVDSAGLTADSPSPLTVDYALKEALSGQLYRVSAENENHAGGYSYRLSTATANGGVAFSPGSEAGFRFLESLSLWQCHTGWNAQVNGTTPVQNPGDDGVNIVAFDNDGDPLPGGVLGRASNFYSSCGGDSWRLTGIDIRFKRQNTGADWYFGGDPGSQPGNQDDFASVALHELGHNEQHGHINDQNDVMYYSLAPGTNNRSLSQADIDGGLEQVSYSAAYDACGVTGMLAVNCASLPMADFGASPLGVCGDVLSVQFEDRSTNLPDQWAWNLGDGTGASERNPSHLYEGQGLYSVSLEAGNLNGSDSEVKNGFIALTDPPATASCNPTVDAGYNNPASLGIHNVTLNSINHDTDTPDEGDPVVEDFSCSQITVLEPGQMYDISVTTGPANDENVRVYVDWNDDGTMTAGETVFQSAGITGTHSGMFTVPGNAVEDTALRMRVQSEFFWDIDTPCMDLEFGQSEDYSVIVADVPPPPPLGEPSVDVAICGDTAHYAWVRLENEGSNPNIIYRNCAVGGSCGPITKLVGAATAELNPAVACSGSNVLVMWEDYRNSNADLAYRRSTNSGASFGALQFLVQGPSEETEPTLAMSGNVALAVWEDDRNGNTDLASRRSITGGNTWGPLTFLVRSPFDDEDPVVDLDGTNALLAWVDLRFGNKDLAYRRSTDAAASWLGLTFLVKAGTDDKDPALVVDGTTMMIAWVDTRFGNDDLAYRRSTNSGAGFAGLTFLVKAPSDDSEPSIGSSGLDGILTWVDERSGNKNISFRRSGDGGASFGSTARLVAAPTDEFGPVCDLLSPNVACVWNDTRTGDAKPHARDSSNGGATFGPRFELD